MTLQQLEYIVALDTHRHFSKAAEACFVTQPTLTMQLKKLEEEIGVMLFDRKKHPLAPTPAGEQIVAKARQIIREVNDLKNLLSNEIERFEGTYRLGVIPTIAPYLVPKLLSGFSEKYPDTHLVVEEMKTSRIIEALRRDELDLGILVTPLNEPLLREEVLYYEPFLVYSSLDNKMASKKDLTTKDLPDEGLFLLNEGHCFREQMLNLCDRRSGASSNFSYESGSLETLMRMVKEMKGYTLVPELAVKHELDSPHVSRFKSPEPVREVSLVTHNTFAKEGLLDALRKEVLAFIPNRFEQNDNFFRVKWR